MDTKPLEKFAQSARRSLHEQVAARLTRVLTTDSAELRAKARTIEALKARVKAQGRDAVIEQVAYTWFNRFCALRYMDVNAYTRVGTVSPVTSPAGEAFTQPEILQEAKLGHIDDDFVSFVDAETVFGLLNGRQPSANPQQEAYRLLLVAVCNSYHDVMPFMFEEIDHYTELLMPDDLLSAGSILQVVREALTPERCQDVEVIGWLYQFYISEKKDAVMARKGAVAPEDIPAVTQLFTPHWIVRYMVENSLGRLWMLNHPDSQLVERMDYYIPPPTDEVDSGGRVDSGQWTVDRPEGESARNGESSLSTDHRPLSTSLPPITSPEDIRLCDPACGSGHILTYAFDLLYAIYEEQGYNPVEIPRLILEKNLTGIEIDERAGALAGFALMMKARARDRRFFQRRDSGRPVLPNIVVMEDVVFTPQELDAYMDAVGRDLFTQSVRDWLQQFEQAKLFGSLIRPLVTDTAFIRQRLDEVGVFENLFLSTTNEKLVNTLRMTEALAPCNQVVVANPPYMGSASMGGNLRTFASDHYPLSRRDLCTMFIERNLDFAEPHGLVAMITMQSWMFLSSFEDLRKRITDRQTIETMLHLGPRAFDTISGEVVSTTAFTLCRRKASEYEGQYFRLVEGNDEDEKAQMLLRELRRVQQQSTPHSMYRASTADLAKIPGVPIAYWVSRRVRQIFDEIGTVGEVSSIRAGMATGDNDRHVRLWHEVRHRNLKLDAASDQEVWSDAEHKWVLFNKGGSPRKWYGNTDYVLNYDKESYALLRVSGNRCPSEAFYFRECLTWSDVTSGDFCVRYFPEGSVFSTVGNSIFEEDVPLAEICCCLACNVVAGWLRIINPTLHANPGDVARIPFVRPESDGTSRLFSRALESAKLDWDSFETSWGFERSPLIVVACQDDNLETATSRLRVRGRNMVRELQHLEEENNKLFIANYGLEDEESSDVACTSITLACNPYNRYGNSNLKVRKWEMLNLQWPKTCYDLSAIAAEMAPDMPEEDRLGLEQRLLDDTMREFISYAVGCMFGRYSLDKPGLILANQGETVADYVRVVSGQGRQNALTVDSREKAKERITFMPDEDNVIPILDGEWFADDITERFKQFLRVTFGSEHYEENLAFIEAAIGRDIRGYFLREFYDDHVKTYQKRPIYWLFSSPNGSFNALIYMHRYQPDTVSIVLNDYLREYAAKLTARKRHLEQAGIQATASQRDKAQATKEVEQIDKILAELRAYEDEVLYPLAMRRVEIDLDDGVAVNYPKFGRALARVKGLS